MSTITYDIAADCTATSFTASANPGFTGNGAGLTSISSASLNMGATTGYAVYSNGPSGLASEQYLSTTRGGLGINATALTGALIDTAGVITAQTVDSANTASAIVARDATGTSAFSEVVTPLLTETVAAGSATVFPSVVSNQTVGTSVAKSYSLLGAAATAAAVPTIIASIPVPASSVSVLKVDTSFGQTGGAVAGMISFIARLKVAAGVGESPTYQNKTTKVDAALVTSNVTVAYASGTGTIDVSVTGVAATAIKWASSINVVTITC